jgi:curved DNA-binding protein CbpA
LEDYYAILGLDPDASPESIKVAYRRLARQNHPDLRTLNSTEAEKASVAAHMAQLNEAYAVLSHAKQRREYDDKLRLEGMLATKDTATAARDLRSAARPSKTSTKTEHPPRIRPREEVDSTVVN